MSNNNSKEAAGQESGGRRNREQQESTSTETTRRPAVPAPKPVTPPLFRKIDWLTFGITTLAGFQSLLLTLAPDLTLEDCGELAGRSFYAGVPHPPGYPIWTIYTWLFTGVSADFQHRFPCGRFFGCSRGAGCGLLALMVSRAAA